MHVAVEKTVAQRVAKEKLQNPRGQLFAVVARSI